MLSTHALISSDLKGLKAYEAVLNAELAKVRSLVSLKMEGSATIAEASLTAKEALHGLKLNAIKALREVTVLGLKEAKDIVDSLDMTPGRTVAVQFSKGFKLSELHRLGVTTYFDITPIG